VTLLWVLCVCLPRAGPPRQRLASFQRYISLNNS